jgi:hypothetical protein
MTTLLLSVALSVPAAAPIPKVKDAAPLPVAAVYKGKLTQRGGRPNEFDCAFTVTRREGEKFEASIFETFEQIEVTYLVRGTITAADPNDKAKGFKIEFTSYEAKDVKKTVEILDVQYTGTFDGKKLKGAWKLPPEFLAGNLNGEFEFELGKKEKE